MDEHADDCDCVLSGACGANRGWVVHADWDDAAVCTCDLKAVMERRAVYGDERLIGDLPFDANAEGRA